MASINLEEQWEELEPTEEEPMIEDCQEVLEDVKTNDENLEKPTAEATAKETVTTTTALSSSRSRYHRKLPAELNREIFLCLNPATQRKFIYGLGWDFYAMFRYRLLTKSKRICNPTENSWKEPKGMPESHQIMVALPSVLQIGRVFLLARHSLFLANMTDRCDLAGERNNFELQGASQPKWKHYGNVFGCGLLLDPNNKLAIFFTLNGKLKGQQTPISPSVGHLFPTVTMNYHKGPKRSLLCILHATMETNFGDNPAKPFEYDIKKCTGMGMEWI